MQRLQDHFHNFVLEAPPRLETAGGRQVENAMTGIVELAGAAPAARRGRSASFVSRFFAAEMKTWRGQQPLWLTFWIYGVAVSGAIALLYGAAIYTVAPAVQEGLLIALGVYTGWVLISLWRCTEGAKHLFGVMARFLIAPWGINVALVLAFMQVGLLAQLLRFG